MIVKLFGLLDILAGISLFLLKFGFLKYFALVLAIYLIIKGIVFFGFPGVIDILSGIVIIIAMFGVFNVVYYIFIIWLVQKGLLSLVS